MRFTIHVDAGYLYAALATRTTGTSLRQGIRVDEKALIRALIEIAAKDCDADLLRLLWYDAAKDGIPRQEQRRIGLLDGVKLRIGRINFFGEQKGVDLRLGLDLVSLGINRSAGIAYLISGDDDLTEAVVEAQDLGIQVKLISVPTADGTRRQAVSENLVMAADGALTIPADVIERTVVRQLTPSENADHPHSQPPDPAPSSAENPAAASDAAGTPPTVSATPPTPVVPQPAPLTPRPGAVRPPSPQPRPEPVRPTPPSVVVSEPFSTNVYSSRTDSAPLIGQPVTVDPELIGEVAYSVWAAWKGSASPQQRADLHAGRPSIPQELDRILLIDLVARTSVSDIPTWARYMLRERFWAAFDDDNH